jgi:hypothetical protein
VGYLRWNSCSTCICIDTHLWQIKAKSICSGVICGCRKVERESCLQNRSWAQRRSLFFRQSDYHWLRNAMVRRHVSIDQHFHLQQCGGISEWPSPRCPAIQGWSISFLSARWTAFPSWWAPSTQSYLVLRCQRLAFCTTTIGRNTPATRRLGLEIYCQRVRVREPLGHLVNK